MIYFPPDFGMMGEFKQELRDGFIEACLHLVNRDFDALAKDFVTLGYHDYLSFYWRLFSLILVFRRLVYSQTLQASSANCRQGSCYKGFNRFSLFVYMNLAVPVAAF